MLEPNSLYFWTAWLSPTPPPRRHALPLPLTHKDISCRGNLAPISRRRVFPLLSCHVCDVICVISNESCLIYVMLLLYFRPVKEKKTLLLRNHSICSDPQRFTFALKVVIRFYQLLLQTVLLGLIYIVKYKCGIFLFGNYLDNPTMSHIISSDETSEDMTHMLSHLIYGFIFDVNSKSIYEEEPLHMQVPCSDALSWKAKFYPHPPPPRCKQLFPLNMPTDFRLGFHRNSFHFCTKIGRFHKKSWIWRSLYRNLRAHLSHMSCCSLQSLVW